jgi:hypothetical protein
MNEFYAINAINAFNEFNAFNEINEFYAIYEFYAINAVREWMNGLLDGWIMKIQQVRQNAECGVRNGSPHPGPLPSDGRGRSFVTFAGGSRIVGSIPRLGGRTMYHDCGVWIAECGWVSQTCRRWFPIVQKCAFAQSGRSGKPSPRPSPIRWAREKLFQRWDEFIHRGSRMLLRLKEPRSGNYGAERQLCPTRFNEVNMILGIVKALKGRRVEAFKRKAQL